MATGKFESKPITVTTTVYTIDFTEEELLTVIDRCAAGRLDPTATKISKQLTEIYDQAHPVDTKNPKPVPVPDDLPDTPKKITVIKPQ